MIIESVRCRKEGGQARRLMRDLLTEGLMGICNEPLPSDPFHVTASAQEDMPAVLTAIACKPTWFVDQDAYGLRLRANDDGVSSTPAGRRPG